MGLPLRSGVMVVAILLLAATRPLDVQRPPQLGAGRLPFSIASYDHEFGFARIRVAVRDDGTADASVVEAQPVDLGVRVLEFIRRWRFQENERTEFVAEVRFHERATDPCDPDWNDVIEARLPDRIDIYTRREMMICHEAPTIGGLTAQRRAPVRGTVVDVSGQPLGGVSITFYGIRETQHIMRRLRVDADGRFLVSNVPPGVYAVAFFDEVRPLQPREFHVTVSPDAPDSDLTVIMFPQPARAPDPAVLVRDVDIPVYPESAITAGLEGTVDLRLSFAEEPRGSDRYEVTDIDASGSSPVLVAAARGNVATWRIDSVETPVLKVRYTFRLLPGDCHADQRPHVVMEFPHAVEIVARRRIPCDPAVGSLVPKPGRLIEPVSGAQAPDCSDLGGRLPHAPRASVAIREELDRSATLGPVRGRVALERRERLFETDSVAPDVRRD